MMVKICGITNREDALAAIEGGAAMLGFNFYPESSRYLTLEQAAELFEALPAAVCKVGVFVNEPAERVAQTAHRLGLDVVQLHGDESPDDYPAGLRVWKGIRVGPATTRDTWEHCPAEAVLLDGAPPSLYGGSGKAFDWSLAARSAKKIILGGGLDAGNVQRAIQQARPWAVDACSRIESAPGKKDHVKMAQFLKAALAELS